VGGSAPRALREIVRPRLQSAPSGLPLNFTVRGLMGQRYEYCLALRIHHPSVNPREISRTLRMRPRISWYVGEPRASLSGAPLPGVRNDTYWSKTITPCGVKVPRNHVAEVKLTTLVKRLRRHASFFQKLRRTGGRVEVWLSTFGTRNYSFIFPPGLIRELNALGCEFIVDIYPYRQRWGA
jgi:hypothetical protein